MPIDWLSLGLSGAGGLANMLFGGGGYELPPELQAYLDKIKKDLGKTDSELGLSTGERTAMAQRLREAIDKNAGRAIGGYQASAARRGMGLQPSQTAGFSADVLSSAGKDYGEGIKDIDLSAIQMGRQRRSELEGRQMGVMGMTRYNPGTDFGAIFEKVAEKVQQGRGQAGGESDYFNQAFDQNQGNIHQQYPQAFGRQRMRWNPQTGRFEWVNE